MKNLNRKTTISVSFCALLLFTIVFEIHAAPRQKSATNEIIVNATEARVRNAPNLSAKILGATRIGTIYQILGKRGDWYHISFEGNNSGWISGTIVEPFDESRRESIYQNLATKYLNRPKLDFDTAAELFRFLSDIQTKVAGTNAESDLALSRLDALAAALKAMRDNKTDKSPYKDFIKANEGDIVYSDSAEYFVIADLFWKLREKYSSLPIADEIAWKAAQTSLPGECEGFVVCYLDRVRYTDGKYLEYYPNGKHSREALRNLLDYLKEVAAGAYEQNSYESISSDERPQLEEYVAQLRRIIAKSSNPATAKIFDYLNTIEAGYHPKENAIYDDKGLDEFWTGFKAAVISGDKNSVAGMSKFPLSMPFGQKNIETKVEFLRRYAQIFNGETDATKCFEKASLLKATGRYGVYCGFKNALDDEDNKPIYYSFEKGETVWKFVGLDNINE